jgi:hypothetical protein
VLEQNRKKGTPIAASFWQYFAKITLRLSKQASYLSGEKETRELNFDIATVVPNQRTSLSTKHISLNINILQQVFPDLV